ncbi:unnamed protein product [Mytilus edulis]|uniref:Uncharacterized protein n=1 Tax=Mytilus edulis TaxID=6550 RepID=A0A8S3SLR0_MYTED|nr:unnamed protein product [Mytilus edulis]
MSTFSSPLKLTASQAKIRRMSNQWNLCIICQVSTVEKLSSLSTKGQQTLLDAVNTRKDDVFRRLHDEYSSLADVDIERLCYHKSCYKSYTSRVNLEKFVMPDVNNLKDTSNANQPCCSHPVQTRSMFTPFDWTTCIFCKHKSYKRDKNLRHLESDERLQKISELADHKRDLELKSLLFSEEFKSKALYHRACIANYLLSIPKKEQFNDEKKYCFFLPPELKTRYTSAKLQRRLEKHYGNSIVIQTQKGQGRSNIVFSSSISIAEAIQAASHLKCELKLSEIEAEVEIGPINEDQTLHAAASIIRRQLQSLDISNETYPTPSEISLSYSTQHTPCLLTKFLLWIIDDKSYNGEDMSNRAGQQYAVQTFDQQLYAVAQQVKWSMPDVFHSHIIRLGGFHGLSCFIATVGKLWASAGLSDLLVDSGIYASNTVDQMLVGKQFNRGVRGLTLAYEALMVLLFKAFFNWCRDENRMKTIQPNVWKVFLDCHSSFAVPSTPQSTEDIEEFFNVFEEHILPLFEEFRTHYCNKEKAESFPTANAHRMSSRQTSDQIKRPAPIIVRFINYGDKQYALSKGYNLSDKHMRVFDDLPPVMKESRHELAKMAYKIRNEEHLQTRIKVVGTRILLQTQLSGLAKNSSNTDKSCIPTRLISPGYNINDDINDNVFEATVENAAFGGGASAVNHDRVPEVIPDVYNILLQNQILMQNMMKKQMFSTTDSSNNVNKNNSRKSATISRTPAPVVKKHNKHHDDYQSQLDKLFDVNNNKSEQSEQLYSDISSAESNDESVYDSDDDCSGDEELAENTSKKNDNVNVLESMKEFISTEELSGPKINNDLAGYMNQGLRTRPNEDKLKELTQKYNKPANVSSLKVPSI